MLQQRGGALRLDGTHRLRESRRRAAPRRQLSVQGPTSGPHWLIGQSARTRAALTWHPKESIASRGLVRHRRRGLDGACGGGGSHRLGCPPTGLGCLHVMCGAAAASRTAGRVWGCNLGIGKPQISYGKLTPSLTPNFVQSLNPNAPPPPRSFIARLSIATPSRARPADLYCVLHRFPIATPSHSRPRRRPTPGASPRARLRRPRRSRRRHQSRRPPN